VRSSSRHCLRESDLVIRRVRRRRVGGPVEDHPEENRVAVRIVQHPAYHHFLLDLRVGESDAVPGRQIGAAPLQLAEDLSIAEICGSRADGDRGRAAGAVLSGDGVGDTGRRVDETGDVVRRRGRRKSNCAAGECNTGFLSGERRCGERQGERDRRTGANATELPLERALELFEKGMRLSETCRKQLEEAETRIETLVRKGDRVQAEPMRPDKA